MEIVNTPCTISSTGEKERRKKNADLGLGKRDDEKSPYFDL